MKNQDLPHLHLPHKYPFSSGDAYNIHAGIEWIINAGFVKIDRLAEHYPATQVCDHNVGNEIIGADVEMILCRVG